MSEPAPLALQLAVRVEKAEPPDLPRVCAAAALATIALLDHPSSHAGGEWSAAVSAWNGARIRKIVRRGRGAAWTRAQSPPGVTIERDGVEARAYVPGPTDQVPESLAKLQIQSTPLPEPELVDAVPTTSGLVIAVNPGVEMSWGKQAAQCAHAGQRAWMTASPHVLAAWEALGRPLTVIHPTEELWPSLVTAATTQIHDGGYTEIPAGTLTTVAWWTLER